MRGDPQLHTVRRRPLGIRLQAKSRSDRIVLRHDFVISLPRSGAVIVDRQSISASHQDASDMLTAISYQDGGPAGELYRCTKEGVSGEAIWNEIGVVNDCARSADGKTIAVATSNASVNILAVDSDGKVRMRSMIDSQSGAAMRSCDISNSGWVAGCDETGIAYVHTGAFSHHLKIGDSPARWCGFNPDGKILFVGNEQGALVRGWAPLWSSGPEGRLSLGAAILDGSFDPSSQDRLALVLADGTVPIVESGRVAPTSIRHEFVITHCAFSADGALLLTASRDDGLVKIWDRDGKERLATVKIPGLSTVTFTAEGAIIAGTHQGQLLGLEVARS